MKPLLLPILALLSGCTSIPTPHGTAILGGDYTHVVLTDGPVRFSADKATHSTVARVHWHGATNLAAEAVAGAIGLHGANQVVSGLTTVIPPVVNRPTTRATPSP